MSRLIGLAAIFLCVAAAAAAGTGSDAIRAHTFRAGEAFHYLYNDTDTTYCSDLKDGLAVASAPLLVQQIKIPSETRIRSSGAGLEHQITLGSDAAYRSGTAQSFADAAFSLVGSLIKGFPAALSYVYPDEASALSHLSEHFAQAFGGPAFMADPVSQFLFFKVQDIHQMQASALGVRDGLTPGQSYVQAGRDVPGLGGSFVNGASQYVYDGIQHVDGQRAALVRVNNLGNQFSTGNITVYTNFTFQMLIALTGPNSGLLLSGYGQETAYPVMKQVVEQCHQPVLQRQFTIILQTNGKP